MSERVVAMTETLHERLAAFLLRSDGQEDVCFGVYSLVEGARRWTALLLDVVLPLSGERSVHGNASFESAFFRRALTLAERDGLGLALLHSHPLGVGWQGMSRDDVVAENRHAGATLVTTLLPLVGLTIAGNEAWSARAWIRQSDHTFLREECSRVRVVGKRLRMTYHPSAEVRATASQLRTVSFWGARAQADFAGLSIGVVGGGSVGSIVAESLARMGARSLTVVDHDVIEEHNLDRTLGANRGDVGTPKVRIVERQSALAATAAEFTILPVAARLEVGQVPRELLDCDVVFSCVDRPVPRHALNRLAYSYLIPVIDGGILVRFAPGGERFLGADWAVHTIGPGRPCLLCRGAYDLESVSLEQTGLLEDPKYVEGLPENSPLRRRENVFPLSAAVASFEVLQLVAMVSNLMGLSDLQQQRYSYYPGVVRIEELGACRSGCPFPPLVQGHIRYP